MNKNYIVIKELLIPEFGDETWALVKFSALVSDFQKLLRDMKKELANDFWYSIETKRIFIKQSRLEDFDRIAGQYLTKGAILDMRFTEAINRSTREEFDYR